MARSLVPDDLFARVLRARTRVRDAYDEPLTVASLARTARLSPFHFLRVYSAAFGATPDHDLARVRLVTARELLARGSPVTDACFAVGFSSLGSFSARFKREFGITPRAFQRAARRVTDGAAQVIARCSCRRVEYEASGSPIVSLICFCDDCQAGSQQLEALAGARSVREPDGGTAYVVYRKDRVQCVRGGELRESHKLREGSATSRVAASCCHSAMVMWFDDAKHWVPVYRARLGGGAPEAEMRICTKFAPAGAAASDAPSYPGYPVKLLAKLLGARVAMLFGR